MRTLLKSERKFDAQLEKPFTCFCSDSDPPDYTPMANASRESAEIMAALGREQLDFAKQQYADAKPLFEQIVRQQMDIAGKTAAQGDDYYEYLKSFRPVERAMMDEAMRDRSEEIAAYDAANRADAALLAGPNQDIYNRYRADIEADVDRALADTQGSYTRALNQMIRQGLRYGGAFPNIASQASSIGLAQAQSLAAAANAARNAGIEQARNRVATGLQLRQSNMGALNKERAIDWAKKLDAAGLVKGMPGASQGAYGLAINAGNAAGQNQLAPGAQYMQGMAQGASTIGQGRQLYQSGLGSILNSQTQLAAAEAGKPNPLGTIIGMGLGGWASGGFRF